MTHDDDRMDDPTRPSAERSGGNWSRFEFEAALPLYVGGDLDPADASFVEAWIARHPEDRELLDAARSARAVLEAHARSAHERPVPDLWPSVREELARAGSFSASPSAPEPDRSIPAPGAVRPVEAATAAAPILGGSDRFGPRFRTRIAAVAAAVLLVSSVGLFVGQGGGATGGGAGSTAGETDGSRVASEPVFTGHSAPARMVRATAGGRGTPLSRPAGGAVHLIDHAPTEPFWQAPGNMQAVELLPLNRQALDALNPAQRESAELVRERR
ncbi:MAG: hypothetical protein AAGI22_27250 [Planctomycetota bacterium]